MTYLGHYLRIHLTGAAGGIELFSRGKDHGDAEARPVLLGIRDELIGERRQVLQIAADLGVRPAPFSGLVAKVGERVSRAKPNGDLLHRTPLTDLIDLETMRVALSGKIAGWEALLTASTHVADLPTDELQALLDQARRQLEQVSRLHTDAAQRALTL